MATAASDLENQPGESLRDALDEAFEQHGADDSGADAPKVKAQAPAEPEPKDEPAAKEAADDQPTRDQSGRFAKSQKAAAEAQEGAAKALTAEPGTPGAITPPPAPGEFKAPASWTPAARELWKEVPAPLQAEIHRREGEAQRVLQQSAQTRQFQDAFENVVRPYELFIRQEGSNPLQAVQNLMQTAAEFRVGTPSRKVELVAGMIRNFNVDLEMLDQHLARSYQPGQQQAQQPQQFRDPRLDQLLAMQQAQQQQAAQADQQVVQQTIQAFASDPKHEFYGDVSTIMGDLLQIRANRGELMDLEAAYKQACNMHEGVSTILAQRAAGQRPGGTSQAVLRQKRAAASIKGDGTPGMGQHVPKDDSIRASIEAAFEASADR